MIRTINTNIVLRRLKTEPLCESQRRLKMAAKSRGLLLLSKVGIWDTLPSVAEVLELAEDEVFLLMSLLFGTESN